MNSPIICAGFHRSGTSLAAQQLHSLGYSFALEPMGGNLSNPDGHFEDEVAMRMHDHLLAQQGADWMYADGFPFSAPESSLTDIERYIAARSRVSGSRWVMKDPRATLMLEQWHQALKGNGRFVLLYRHWAFCIQSLLKRHSQDIAYFLPTGAALASASAFWKDVTLAARMWLSYNLHVINFVKENPEISVVIAQSELISGLSLSHVLSAKFQVAATAAGASCVNKSYVEETVDASVLALLPDDLIRQMDDVFQQLEALNFSGKHTEPPTYVDRTGEQSLEDYLWDRIPELPPHAEAPAVSPALEKTLNDMEGLSFDDLRKRAEPLVHQISSDTAHACQRIADILQAKGPQHFAGYEWQGRCAFARKAYEAAEVFFLKAIAIQQSPPYLRMLLANVYVAQLRFDEAAYFHQLAYTMNPNNFTFAVKTAETAMLQGKAGQAMGWYEKAMALTPAEWVRVRYGQAMAQAKGKDAALVYLSELLKSTGNDLVERVYLTQQLELKKPGAVEDFHRYIRSGLNRERVAGFLSALGQSGLDRGVMKHLSHWLIRAWKKLHTPTEILSLIIPVEGRVPSAAKISAVVISYNMTRELPRTLKSLQASFQQGMSVEDIDIVLVDNGSAHKPTLAGLGDFPNLRIVSFPFKSQSPVQAVNLGLSLAQADVVGVFIDGARMASPGLLKGALAASKIDERAVVATLGFHLGPEVQMQSVLKGYNQKVEDKLLAQIGWEQDGYRLFAISSLAGSSAHGYFKPIAESNALFMHKTLWKELGGIDERFITPGGGYANLDLYKRACETAGNQLVILLNEGTFHQVHGGVATNLRRDDATHEIFSAEYQSIRGERYAPPAVDALYIGQYVQASAGFLKMSVEKAEQSSNPPVLPDKVRHQLNRVVLEGTYCAPYSEDPSIAESVLDSPVIVTGRGGSGTRLLSQLIQDMNIFMGNEINATEDSVEWVGPIYDLVVNRVQLARNNFTEDHIRRLRNNARNILAAGGLSSGLWGFKLPETVLCLPELKRAFPKARFIHLTRHPISISMRRTHMTSRLDNPVGRTVLEDAYHYIGEVQGALGDGTDAVNNSVSWNYQLNKAVSFLSQLAYGQDVVQVKYEDILRDPDAMLSKLQEFLGLEGDFKHNLTLDSERANVIAEHNAMTDLIWSICSGVAEEIGYEREDCAV
ncbi:sulfotransferase [Thalassolituus sp. LLYu03]|uniref:sulfotransferase n=1 Tax=Thalassolituus sp. LLYu03 TaxID=3421656 RepID=UPI003D2E8BC9